MSPKSLLRNPKAVSTVSDLTDLGLKASDAQRILDACLGCPSTLLSATLPNEATFGSMGAERDRDTDAVRHCEWGDPTGGAGLRVWD